MKRKSFRSRRSFALDVDIVSFKFLVPVTFNGNYLESSSWKFDYNRGSIHSGRPVR